MAKLLNHLSRPASLLQKRPSLTRTPTTTPAVYNATTPAPSSVQCRAATFVPRVRRPYTFTQMIQLSDGSTFTVRSTSPTPLIRSAKDTRNHAMWQPTDKSLKNVEVDEAGKLAAFRERFGRGFDLAANPDEDATADSTAAAAPAAPADNDASKQSAAPAPAPAPEEDAYDLGDLISGYAASSSVDQSKLKGSKKGHIPKNAS